MVQRQMDVDWAVGKICGGVPADGYFVAAKDDSVGMGNGSTYINALIRESQYVLVPSVSNTCVTVEFES